MCACLHQKVSATKKNRVFFSSPNCLPVVFSQNMSPSVSSQAMDMWRHLCHFEKSMCLLWTGSWNCQEIIVKSLFFLFVPVISEQKMSWISCIYQCISELSSQSCGEKVLKASEQIFMNPDDIYWLHLITQINCICWTLTELPSSPCYSVILWTSLYFLCGSKVHRADLLIHCINHSEIFSSMDSTKYSHNSTGDRDKSISVRSCGTQAAKMAF